MESEAFAMLVGVVVGFALGAGTKAQALTQLIGDERVGKLLRLLELLEEPESRSERRRRERRT